MPNPIIIAHRGESFEAPENTLAAINLAWKKGAQAVEIDIQLTKDNEIVVIHDTNTRRITGVSKKVKHTTLTELKLLNAGFHKGSPWEKERIPTLNEVLKTVPKEGKIIIEIKSDAKILPVLKSLIEASGLDEEQIEIIAFNFNTLKASKKLMPQFNTLWLMNLDYYLPHWLCIINKSFILNKIKRHNLDGINVFAGKMLGPKFIKPFRAAGYLIYTWTVNNPKKAEQYIGAGLHGITTDRASWLNLQLKHMKLK